MKDDTSTYIMSSSEAETDIIQMINILLQEEVSLQKIKTASYQDPILSQLSTYI